MVASMPLPPDLRPDCASCAGLCCVAPAFDAAQGFGFDKPAHTPCRHLTEGFACAIHAHLAADGFPGCIAFDCFGAGQYVVQHLFPGRSWREGPEAASAIFAAYAAALRLFEALALLTLGEERATGDRRGRISAQLAVLEEIRARVSAPSLTQADHLLTSARTLLRELRAP